jgi:quercetin dioxygenase-like cupin family protein
MEFSGSRRLFGRDVLVSGLAAVAANAAALRAFAENGASGSGSTRREVIRQSLPGEPQREMTLVEVIYAPDAGSPPHLHANGVMAFVVSGKIASQVGDAPETIFGAGDAWWEPPGAIHRISRNASTTEPAVLLAIYVTAKDATAADLMKPL